MENGFSRATNTQLTRMVTIARGGRTTCFRVSGHWVLANRDRKRPDRALLRVLGGCGCRHEGRDISFIRRRHSLFWKAWNSGKNSELVRELSGFREEAICLDSTYPRRIEFVAMLPKAPRANCYGTNYANLTHLCNRPSGPADKASCSQHRSSHRAQRTLFPATIKRPSIGRTWDFAALGDHLCHRRVRCQSDLFERDTFPTPRLTAASS